MSQPAGVEGTVSQGQENNGTGNQGQETQQQNQGQETQQQNNQAPYAPYLEKVPETVRGIVEPVFKEWDAGVNRRFQQLHSQLNSQYSWAQPWQEIAEQFEPDTVNQALQLLGALEENPQGLYEALGKAYNITPQQAQQVVEQGQQGNEGREEFVDPRFQQLQDIVGQLAETILGDKQAQQEKDEEQQFLAELDRLKSTHGEYDMDYVITKVAAGMEPEAAVLQYRELVGKQAQQLMTPGQQAPVVMGSGGGVPSNSTDLKNLGRKDTVGLVANVLAANQNQG